jgi:hypothetical protein
VELNVDCKLQFNSGRMHSKLALVEAKEYCALDANDEPVWWEDADYGMVQKGPTVLLVSSLSMYLRMTSP